MTQIIELAATTAKAASLFGVGTIVKNAVQMVTAEAELSEIRKVCVGIASTAIAGATTTAAVKWIDEEAKWADEQFKKLKSEVEKKKKEEIKVETIIKKSEEGKTTTEIAEELNIPERKATTKKTSKKKTTKKEEEKMEEPKEESKDESKEA